jgi:hypothetical protein
VIVVKKVYPTLHIAEIANCEVKIDTAAEEVTNQKEDTDNKVHAAGKGANPLSEVQDEFCPNNSYETKSNSTLSYIAAVAPPRKLGVFDY